MTRIKYLLDSTVVIDHFNGIPQATRWIKDTNRGDVAISAVTIAEVLTGFAQDDWHEVHTFFEQFNILVVDHSVASTAAQLRQIYRFKLPDAFQAALAVNHNLILITRNSRDFLPKKHPFVQIPYSL